VKFLIDNHLPLALAVHLRKRGHDCVHVLDANLSRSHDVGLWEIGKNQNRAVISKDEDFVFLANRPGDTGLLVWVRLGNCRNLALISAFDQIHDQLIQAFASGQRIVEVR
jgi:predicted nuclease of predicted toxin-antitoxin system